MHDKNGKPLQAGDFVKLTTYVNGGQVVTVAKIVVTKPEATLCNVYVAVPYTGVLVREEYANAHDVEKVEL